MDDVRSGFSDGPDARIYIQEWGEGPALVCLHGLGGGGHFFAPLGAELGSHTHVIAPDLPGCGHSASASGFSFDECAGAVVALAHRRRWSRACLLGHSMGTIVALEAIRREPSLAAGLIAVGGLPEPPDDARARFAARIQRVERGGLAGLADEVIAANFSERTRRERPELTGLFGRAFELQAPDRYVDATRALARWTARPLPPMEGVACLVATGTEDRYASPEAVRRFAQALPDTARVEILDDCGHLPFLERPAAFARLVEGFLQQLRARG